MYKGAGRRYQRRRRRRTKTVFVVKFRFDLAIVVIHVCKQWRSPRYFELKPPKICLNFYTLRIYSKRNDIEIDTINKSKRMAFLFAYDEKWVFLSTIYILLISAYNWIKESTHKVILLFKELWIKNSDTAINRFSICALRTKNADRAHVHHSINEKGNTFSYFFYSSSRSSSSTCYSNNNINTKTNMICWWQVWKMAVNECEKA